MPSITDYSIRKTSDNSKVEWGRRGDQVVFRFDKIITKTRQIEKVDDSGKVVLDESDQPVMVDESYTEIEDTIEVSKNLKYVKSLTPTARRAYIKGALQEQYWFKTQVPDVTTQPPIDATLKADLDGIDSTI